jgi:membrane protease subunit (stomatin/prohibitin family)
VENSYTRDKIDSQLKSELLTALQPAFAKISDMGIRYSALPGHTSEIANALNDELSASWKNKRGIEIVAFGVNSVKASEDDEEMIQSMQQAAAYQNPGLGAAAVIQAQTQAMKDAANNAGGAAVGFMNMNMAAQAGGANAAELYSMAAAQNAAQQTAGAPAVSANSWTCPNCGSVNTGKFCPECGMARPSSEWTCPSCGTVNKGKFCTECGTGKP